MLYNSINEWSCICQEHIFKQIGIYKSIWYDREGISLGADGLRITSYDMLKFGNLFLNNGCLNSNQIISSEWIKESITALYKTYDNIGYYAYHWWVSSFNNKASQLIIILL
ncbi:putative 6-aminohexanoate-dimer hydrolase [Clostridium argentinense CDC 2741]|uniref:Putative 6-aminohexanoate-dimer hydrolase n=1 Tax=Clostridium argentinense CDC 2741 TaxID=1418104 RepID=A0A0C1U0F9_9CLOT|nr:hypothetical protein [Clostridium argentinense]ARC85018.1 hypothetical protein RSJ17_11100 [Clostridium argentinense]KIE46294.1 putative 6-aminohexanoate-dimer hydrolase [Clostridium argentinense CDC 2741]NFF40453.1 hypothetical protein [Clostridium argentinense]NFP50528.1 hypothetical protein [Clostridium argentinense]NFP72866.1 hypothetical protein [Clostridium argentinense]